ncbi:LytTR family transcriptional regulator DNA-binding domain-containing protein [Enterococcus sp. N342-3-1-2]
MRDYLIVKNRNEFKRVTISEIASIEICSEKEHYVIVTKLNLEKIRGIGSLNKIEIQCSNSLVRCHRKTLININQIKKIDAAKRELTLSNGSQHTISRRRLKYLIVSWLDLENTIV